MMANKTPGAPEEPESLPPPLPRKLTPAHPPKTGQLKTGNLHPTPPSPHLPALTGPLDPWPEILELIGSPIVRIDLRTGEVDEGRHPPLGEVDVAVLRVISQRSKRNTPRWLIHLLVFQRQGDESRVDEAVADLQEALGPFGKRIEAAGKDAWQFWAGPD